jgi:hypothetical protein
MLRGTLYRELLMGKEIRTDYGHQAFRILQVAFVIAPIVAGVDKFFDFLTRWSMYLSPMIPSTLGMSAKSIMMIVGVIEIIAGLGVIFKPKLFSYIVFLWLLLIVLNLISKGMFYDIVLRDVGLMLSALAFARLSHRYA